MASARSSPAQRQRRWRQRQRDGRAVLPVGVEIDRLVVALVEDRFLASETETDRAVICRALEQAIRVYIAATLVNRLPTLTPIVRR